MFGFLKKKDKEEFIKIENRITEEVLTSLLESKIGDTKRDFKFIDTVDIVEVKVLPEDRLYAKLKLKHKNGDSVEVSVTDKTMHFRTSLTENIEKVVTQTWKFEFEDLLSNLRKSLKIIGDFENFISDRHVVALTYLGTRYKMPIRAVIGLDDKLRESNLDPIYEDVRVFTNDYMNEYGHCRESMNIYGIAKWWIDIHK